MSTQKSKHRFICSMALILLSLVTSCTIAGDGEVLFSENFDQYKAPTPLPDEWWVEGNQNVIIENQHLRMNSNPGPEGKDYVVCTIWLNKIFSGDLQIDFDAHTLASEAFKNKPDWYCTVNFFFLFSDPKGKPLYKTRQKREDGDYFKYHKLNGYVYTFVANGSHEKARFRFRDDPGFNLLQENYAYNNYAGRTYHFTITKIKNRITYAVDGKVFLDKIDDEFAPVHEQGLIGLRAYKTDLWWDNITVTRPVPPSKQISKKGKDHE